ncbi:MAG: ABC transporter substrate-binding protein [Lactobacillales bacterium]|jgi:ABC-type branched-subunit amino acid transport system substrate-binding protein|nr:ABC transporter substrate-binding protein [Lactobacillales bacterium]
MRKIFWICVVAVLVGIGVYVCHRPADTFVVNKPMIKIGATLPLTGNFAELGDQSKLALIKSVEDANENPAHRFHYQLLVENDEMNTKQISNIAHKFVTQDHVNAIVSLFSMSARIVSQVAEKYKVVHFNCGYSDDNILKGKYNFVNFTPVDKQSVALADFLKANNAKSVSLLFENMGGADEILKILLPLLQENGIKYDLQRFNPGERDFKIVVEKMKQNNFDANIFYSFEPEQDIIAREIINRKLGGKISFVEGVMLSKHIDLFNGTYNIGATQASAEFKKKLGIDSTDAAVALYMYDIVQVFVEAVEKSALEKGGIPSGDEIADMILHQKNFNGLAGEYRVAPSGQFYSEIKTYLIKDGVYEPVK